MQCEGLKWKTTVFDKIENCHSLGCFVFYKIPCGSNNE